MTSRPPTAGPTRALRVATVVLAVLWSLLGPVLAPVLPAATGAAGAPQGSDPVGEWPLRPEPEVVAAFDPPDSPYGAGHRGVDLRGSPGQVVHTALAGVVSYAGPLAGRGVVVVDHGTTRTTYQPVTATVAVGDPVSRGSPIGTLELPGSHCFPRACLHWGWIEGASTYLDPLRLVGAGPVRLLPLWRDAPAGPSSSRAPSSEVLAALAALAALF
ncbi:murein hydrolase activator EnvC [Nocardioides sp.]|uniref:murein hydrolase activator EnvC family protein n=1 Tax=Nocardioides sp. TaxID=35761 RepID=UPI00271AFE30|nr:M23 family metallopeptidase [Nocardioides sp.]MDO9458001.1 peptidoglycan DD-metalloendopeptidase family protein [Nocardioides sp.]